MRKKELTILLALKVPIKGMSIEAIADVLEVQPITVSNWISRAAEQYDNVHQEKMGDLNVSKVEMDELWTMIEEK